MLQHEEQPETINTAARARVTPQELAEAVAALEARKEAERRTQEETIPIEDALHHLGLNTSEEELLSEVETLRKQRAHKVQQESYARACRRMYLYLFAISTFTVIAVLGMINLRLRHTLNEITQQTNPLAVRALSQIPDNHVVHADAATLGKLAMGNTPLDQISVDTRAITPESTRNGMFNKEWSLIKLNGRLLINAWATADQALAAGNGQAAELFSNRPAWLPAANCVTVQLPVTRFTRGEVADYSAQGTALKDATGVTQKFPVTDLDHNILDIVTSKIFAEEPTLWRGFDTNIKDGIVHLSTAPDAGNAVQRQHAVTIVEAILRQAQLPYSVVFDK